MAKGNSKQTSPKIASKAAKVLTSTKSSKTDKSIAASALVQARPHKKNSSKAIN